MRLTDAGIAGLKPDKTEFTVWDGRVAGLGVRVRPSGHRSFVWHGHANDSAVRLTIGSAALMTVEDARRECLALQNGSASRMKDPNKESEAPLFREYALGEWKASTAVRWGASRHRSVDRTLAKQLLPAFGALRLDRIRRPLVERWFDVHSQTAPEGANKALQLLRQILNAAVATGLIATNPTQGIKRNPRPKLTRFLSTEEIDRLHRTLDRLVDERSSRAASGRHNPTDSPDGLPKGGNSEVEMVRGRRRRPQAGGDQDRPADGVVEPSRPVPSSSDNRA